MLHTLIVYVALICAGVATAQDSYIGEIKLWPMPWAPSGWVLCNGQSLSISTYIQLYSVMGNTYGGDSQTYFNVPDFRGRFPRGFGAGPSLTNVPLGEKLGAESTVLTGTVSGSITLNANNIPPHSHSATFAGTSSSTPFTSNINVAAGPGGSSAAAGGILAQGPTSGVGAASIFAPAGTSGSVALAGGSGSITVTPAGTVTVANSAGPAVAAPFSAALPSNPINLMNPYTAVNYIICVQGIYPQHP